MELGKISNRGFVLVELIICISIIGILFTIYIPEYQIIDDYKAWLKVEEFKNNIEKYRNLALIESRPYILYINKNRNSYTVKVNKDRGLETVLKKDLGELVEFGNNNIESKIIFGQMGTMSRAGHIYLRTGKVSYKITYTPVTSQINIRREDK